MTLRPPRPRPMLASILPLLLLLAVPTSAQLTWCGKVYMANETVVPPGGQFPTPPTSQTPLLALRCQPSLAPFLSDDSSTAEIVVDALVRFAHIAGAQDLVLPDDQGGETPVVNVTASIDGVEVATGSVALNGTTLLPFSLSALAPRSEPYTLTCTGTLPNQSGSFESLPADLTFLPDPPSGIGSVTKRDLRTGGVLVKKFGAEPSAGYERLLPVGFYSNFGGYLAGNDSAVETLAEQGFNMIHPVPTFDNLTALDELVDKMEELGLWLMYDMRWTYMNLTAVQTETVPLHNRTNLLTYYTGDEPDGTSDPLNATSNAYDLLRSLDPYRPTSLVLNCQNYYFEEYASGADILMQDVYEIGNNVTFSSQWGTPCTPERGDCGCDNCRGEFEDIRDRVEQFRERMEVLGWERSKTIWTVPQGFGNDTYWKRYPTGAEWLVEAIVGLNAGAFGVVSWNDPTTPDIKSAASSLAKSAPSLANHMLSPTSAFTHVITPDRVDIGVWFDQAQGSALILGVNLEYASRSVEVGDVLAKAGLVQVARGDATVIFDGGARIEGADIVFGSVQSGAWVVKASTNATSGSSS